MLKIVYKNGKEISVPEYLVVFALERMGINCSSSISEVKSKDGKDCIEITTKESSSNPERSLIVGKDLPDGVDRIYVE